MNTIDQRILIPAPANLVWEYISNLSRNSEWQADCRSVSFVSQRREGQGTRWRYGAERGREYVAEITTWYNGLGYEYTIVDGPGYRANSGRLRLQEIPEGTMVQWTFSYDLGGVLGGMRNALSTRRQIEATMETSLKTLYKRLSQLSKEQQGESKSLMRDAPDVEARSSYKPRHPSHPLTNALSQPQPPAPPPIVEPPIVEGDGQPLQALRTEPPIEDDDTRPRQVETANIPASAIPTQEFEEPDFLHELVIDEPPVEKDDTQPNKLTTAPAKTTVQEMAALPQDDIQVWTPTPRPVPPPAEPEPNVPEPEATVPVVREEVTPLFSPTPAEAALQSTEAAPDEPGKVPSIWDIFGVPRPSETQEIQTITSPLPVAAISAPPPAADYAPPRRAAAPVEKPQARTGRRILTRRKSVKVRRPL